MNRISSSELLKEFDRYSVEAHKAPIIITYHGRDDLVLLSLKEIKRLKAFDHSTFNAHE